MSLDYSNKHFLSDARTLIDNNQPLEITFIKKWHRNILKNQVGKWHSTSKEIKSNNGLSQAPSSLRMIFMNKLMTIHFLALSTNYNLSS